MSESTSSITDIASVKMYIRKAVSMRTSLLPIRLFDRESTSEPFITRSQLARRVSDQILQECCPPSSTSDKITVEESRIKELTNKLTRFAILSHTWGSDEMTHRDVLSIPSSEVHKNNLKLDGLSLFAGDYDCPYVWMDSVCIDKSSSAELDESIRSMYTWYKTAYVCFVYLSEYDIESTTSGTDPWFYRGWTLQELLAPKRIIFFDKSWNRLFGLHPAVRSDDDFDITRNLEPVHRDYQLIADGGRNYFLYTSILPYPLVALPPPMEWVMGLTSISAEDLRSYNPSPKHARKIFTYMQNRSTTVPEDAAYCLAGLLGITLPTAYGEGADRALYRLQTTCAEESDDRSIFLWAHKNNRPSRFNSMLPGNPFGALLDHDHILPGTESRITSVTAEGLWDYVPEINVNTVCAHVDHTFAFTNGGLRISVILHGVIKRENDLLFCQALPDLGIQVWTDSVSDSDALFQGNLSQFKLAILGTYKVPVDGEDVLRAVPIVLKKLDASKIPKYRRIPCAISLGTHPLSIERALSRAPETVYIV
ncbi:hypothetical protein ONZ45_g13051 [Pleurotus djamor]|nr:hypothetical protein ONZ45_g13051 [Pleurotus djamor]